METPLPASGRSLDFPLTVKMKLLALAPQFYVTDKRGRHIAYVKQKLFKLKEDIRIFSNEEQKNLLYTIAADRIIDFTASYSFEDARTGQDLGSIKRKGMRSLWKAAYEVHDAFGRPQYFVSEESAFTRLLDGIFSILPVISLFAGYVFNPSYLIKNTEGKTVMRLKKQPSLWEGIFKMEAFKPLPPADQQRLMLGLFMVIVLERMRG
ncbi:MAG: hypothetical protein Q4G39_03450 [Brachymonas sp.]|nr:hypothetical protein [Brachymonas sp.]